MVDHTPALAKILFPSSSPATDKRPIKGRELFNRGMVDKHGDYYQIKGSLGNYYNVKNESGTLKCDCPDNVFSHKKCKHIYAVEYYRAEAPKTAVKDEFTYKDALDMADGDQHYINEMNRNRGRGNRAIDAVQVYVNSIEGDTSQLPPKVAKFAKKKGWLKVFENQGGYD